MLDLSLIELAFNNLVYSDIFMDARWAELPSSKQDSRLKNWGYSYIYFATINDIFTYISPEISHLSIYS